MLLEYKLWNPFYKSYKSLVHMQFRFFEISEWHWTHCHHPFSSAIGVFWTLTTLFHGVASLKVITGSRWVFPAAIRAFHVANLAAEGLQSGQDARVHRNNGGGVAVRKSLIFTELRRGRRAGVIIHVAIKQLIRSRCRGSWGTWGTLGPRFSWGSL